MLESRVDVFLVPHTTVVSICPFTLLSSLDSSSSDTSLIKDEHNVLVNLITDFDIAHPL